MSMVLNEEQSLLEETIRDFLSSHAPVASLRQIRDAQDELGYSDELWQQLTDPGTALASLLELELGWGNRKTRLAGGHPGQTLPTPD